MSLRPPATRSARLGLAFLLTAGLSLAACEDDGEVTPGADADATTQTDEGGSPDTVAGDTGESDAPTTTCNAITQTGCGEAENCTYESGTATTPVCVAEGTIPYGGECGGADACERGICLNLNQTKTLCYQFCKTAGHCSDGAACLELQNSTFRVCEIQDIYTSCDLLAQDCEGAKGCYVISGQATPVCLPAGAGQAGDTCDSPSDCAPGTVCVNDRCYELCDKAAPDCPDFVGCSNYSGNAGYCDLP